jgi:hypothetical protein
MAALIPCATAGAAGAAVVDVGWAGAAEVLCAVVEPLDDEHPASATATSAASPTIIGDRFMSFPFRRRRM